MAPPPLSYTEITHKTSYPAIDPTQPSLSTVGKVVVITGASGGIGSVTASSFAASNPRALILLGRKATALTLTASTVRAKAPNLLVQTFEAELTDAVAVRRALDNVAAEFGGIDIVIHSAGVLAPVENLIEVDPEAFMNGYKTTILGTLVLAQAVVMANKARPVTFVNLTTAGILFPPFPGMGAYVSSKMAAVKLLQVFAVENAQVRLHHVHPGFLKTAMSAQLAEKIKLPFEYDDASLPADYLVWLVSPEADFLKDRIVFASWDVGELKTRRKEILGGAPGSGELGLGYQGFPRYLAGQPLFG